MSMRAWADTEPGNDTYAGADALTIGIDEEGSIGNITDDPADYYQITTGDDGTITGTIVLTGTGYVYLKIYDSNGTTELASDLVLSPGTYPVSENGRAAGNYYVAVKSYNTSTLADYTLSVAVSTPPQANDTEDNGTVGTATVISENSSITGHIGYISNGGTYDVNDYYQFTTSNDGNITITFTSSEAGHYNSIYLYDNDGTTLLGSASGYGGDSFTSNGLAAGNYYVRMYYYSAGEYSGYTLTNTVTTDGIVNDIEPNGTYGEALPMTENGSVNGHIGYRNNGGGYDMSDYYQFTTTNDGNITIAFTSTEAAHYNSIYLYDSDGTTSLGSASGYGGDSFTSTGLAAGTYYARIYYYSSGEYSGYTLTNTVTTDGVVNDIEPNGTPAEALTMSENGSVTGHIGYRVNGGDYDQSDYYQFTTTNDGNITITFSSTEATHYNSIYLYDSDGTTSLGSASGYGGDTFTSNGLAAGTYYARIYYYSAGDFSGYTLTNTVTTDGVVNDVEPNGSAAEALPMSENGSVNGHIGYRINGGSYDQSDYYEFTTTNDGDITISFTSSEPSHYNSIYLYDNDGTTSLGSQSGYGTATFTSYGLAAGTYYARIYYYSTGHYSGYTLTNTVAPADYVIDAETNNDAGTALAMLTNSTVEGHIGYRNNGGTYDTYDYYKFTTHSAGDFTLTLANLNSAYNTIQILAADGATVLHSASGYGGASVTHNDGAADTYYARVHYYSSSYFTGYTLTNSFCPDEITIIADGETTFCDGESVVLSTEDHHLSYLWSDGSTTETDAVTLTGDYSLTIDNGGGCIRTSNTISTESTPLPVAVIEADGPTEFCDGGDVTLSVPITPDTYLWSTGETTPTITVSATGDYDVLLSKNGCTAISDPIHITVNPNPVATITPDGSTEFCEGGSVELTATTADTYLWSNGETTASIIADASGDYSVTITDANGCSDMSSITSVTENANPVAGISADGPTTFCSGGSVNLMGTGGATYLWSNGETTSTINVTTSGDYSVTVFSAEGCSDLSDIISVTVEACGTLTISADGPTEFCDGGSVVLTSSEATGNIWSTGETTESIVVTTSGDYYCMNGINTSDIITVLVNANPDATISADGATEFCDGGSVNINAIAGYDSYLWSNGATSSSINVTMNGSYSVEITDNGCSATSDIISVTVNANPDATISADGPTEFCDGGSVNINATAGYDSYLWSNGETTSSINVTIDGSYSVEVTDNGCSATSSTIDVNIDVAPTVSISAISPILCYEGSVDITATTDGTSLQWQLEGIDIPGATNATYSATINGKYTCVASNGTCSTISNTIKIKYADRVAVSPAGAVSLCEPSLMMSVGVYPGSTYQWYQNNEIIVGAVSNTYTTTTVGKFYCLINKDGCTRASKLLLVNPCRLEDDANAFNLAPNPASTSFMINYEISTAGQTSFMIADITGRMIWQDTKSLSEGFYSDEFNTEQFAAGMYLVQIVYADGKHIEQQLVIEK